MAGISSRRPWHRQPTRFTRAESSGLATGLAALYNHGIYRTIFEARNAVTQQQIPTAGITGSLTPTDTRVGAAWNSTGAASYTSDTMLDIVGVTNFTVFAFLTYSQLAAVQNVLDMDASPRVFQFRINATEGVEGYRFDTGAAVYGAIDATAITAAEASNGFFMAMVSSGTSFSMWCNRRKTVGATITGTPQGLASSMTVFARGAANFLTGAISTWCLFTRALDDGEILQLQDRQPWQLYKAPKRRRDVLFIPSSVLPGTSSLPTLGTGIYQPIIRGGLN